MPMSPCLGFTAPRHRLFGAGRSSEGGDRDVWDHSVDVICVGSGGGGLVAALAAKDAGLEPLVVEKQAHIGGSTAMSGGVVWVPNNPLMRKDGVEDSFEAGMAYLNAVVGTDEPCSPPEKKAAFINAGSEMLQFLIDKGAQLIRCPGYADYYTNHPGGNAIGRAIESVPWDSRQLG